MDNFCVTLRPCQHVSTCNYNVNDEIIIITNVATHLLIFKHGENHITHKIIM